MTRRGLRLFGYFLLFPFLVLLEGRAVAQGESSVYEKGLLPLDIDGLNHFLQDTGRNQAQGLDSLLASAVDFELLSMRTFGSYCEDSLTSYEDRLDDGELQQLVGACEEELAAAYRKRLVADLAERLRRPVPYQLQVEDYQVSEDGGLVRLKATAREDETHLSCHVRRSEGKWRIEDLAIGDRLVSRRYRDAFGGILKEEYSLPVLIAHLDRRPYIVLEDFSSARAGQLPKGWKWRKRDEKKPKPYLVEQINGNHYLAAQDTGSSVIMLKFSHWNPREYPILTWCWRVDVLPSGGDERHGRTNDSAAGLYVNFSMNWIGIPKYIKYVWSSTLPVGTVGRRKRIARPWFFVVESGEENLGRWIFEQADLYRDYQRVYDGKLTDRTIGLGILTDANNTGSRAEASYADVRVWTREAEEKGLIGDYCRCFEGGTAGGESAWPHGRTFFSVEEYAKGENRN